MSPGGPDRRPPRLRRSPPRRYRLEEYRRWFPRTAREFLRFLEAAGPLTDTEAVPASDEGPIGVVVVPWVSTPVPWYAVMLAIGLARRGRRVVVLWDDTAFPEADVSEQNRLVGKVLDHVGRWLPVLRVGQAPPRARPGDAELVEVLAGQNLTWRLRGGPPEDRHRRLPRRIATRLGRSLPLVRGALEEAAPDCLVVPGGVYGTSGLFLHEARRRGCRVATFDTDRSIAQICVDGVAAQNGDIARAFRELWRSGAGERARAIERAVAEVEDRTHTRDAYGYQARPSGAAAGAGPGSVLMPLNVEWDTAALGRHAAFSGTVDWVTTTVAEILEADAGPVVVRQHPSERRPLQRSRLDMASILRQRFGDDPRLRFVAAGDEVNSYDLLGSSRLVLPYVSTIAIEAAALGKPVLVSGSSYFADLGFVHSAGSREEYLALLHRGLRGELDLLPEQRDRAWVCYYLTAVANRVSTDFTPHPDDFWSWCRQPLAELLARPEVADILEAIDGDVPISLLRHRRLLAPPGPESPRPGSGP